MATYRLMLFVCLLNLGLVGTSSIGLAQKYLGRSLPDAESEVYSWEYGESSTCFNAKFTDLTQKGYKLESPGWMLELFISTSCARDFDPDTKTSISQEQVVDLIHKSMDKFFALHPDARLDSLSLDLGISPESWGQIVALARKELPELEGTARTKAFPLTKEVEKSWDQLQIVKKLKPILAQYSLEIKESSLLLVIDYSYEGIQWKGLETIKDAGLVRPAYLNLSLKSTKSNAN